MIKFGIDTGHTRLILFNGACMVMRFGHCLEVCNFTSCTSLSNAPATRCMKSRTRRRMNRNRDQMSASMTIHHLSHSKSHSLSQHVWSNTDGIKLHQTSPTPAEINYHFVHKMRIRLPSRVRVLVRGRKHAKTDDTTQGFFACERNSARWIRCLNASHLTDTCNRSNNDRARAHGCGETRQHSVRAKFKAAGGVRRVDCSSREVHIQTCGAYDAAQANASSENLRKGRTDPRRAGTA